ncbi:hypothetical protein B0H11DRAFT_836888 [Mycena galericulata]|nr:hypothetical protein B0H11DRAFT_836888 [Mycena galericulata]
MSSQAVYHALKAPTDPPRVDGPLKIQIASTAWDDESLYMPNKGEVLAEWILAKLLKDKANPSALNPVLDPRFWTLLSQIVSDRSKSTKHWLLPLLNRVPVAPIVSAFLQLLNAVEVQLRLSLSNVVEKSLSTIWPLAVHKISAEALLESFGHFLGSLENFHETNDGLEQIGCTIISSLRVSVGNSSNKKKLSTLFIQNYLRKWIVSSSNHTSPGLQENVYAAGIDVLFTADTLRQVHGMDHPLFSALRNIPDDLVHPLLPRLFASFVQSTRKYRSTLFGQSSGHNTVTIADQIRAVSFSFFDSCQVLLTAVLPTVLTWRTRLGLLNVVAEENLFSGGQLDGQASLQNILPLVNSLLGKEVTGDSAEQASLSVACLSKLMQIDHDLILEDVPRILPQLRRISDPPPSIFHFLKSLLEYHVKTRTIHHHVESLFAALELNPQETYNIQHEYQCSFSSALLHSTHLGWLARSTRKFLTPTQTGQTVRFILERLQTCLSKISATTDTESSRLALTFSFSARLASVVLTALPLQALSDITLREVNDSISDMRSGFLPRSLTKTLKIIRNNVADSWRSQITAASILRLEYALDTPYTEKLWSKIETSSEDENLLPELNLEIFRILLKWSTVDEDNRTQASLDRLLSYLENNFGFLETSWSGVSSSLTFGSQGKAESALAILHMLIDRWLPTIDAVASAPQLQRLVAILVKSNLGNYVPGALDLDATSLLLNALSSAEFWELSNLRAAILAFADEATSALTDIDSNITVHDRATIFSTYQLLLMFPVEYIPRVSRTEMVRRAVNADILCNTLTGANDCLSYCYCVSTFHTQCNPICGIY